MSYLQKIAQEFEKKASDELSKDQLAQEYAKQYQVPQMAKRLEKAMAKHGLPGEVSFVHENDVFMALYAPQNDELGAVMGEGTTPYEALSNLMTDLLENKIEEFKNYLAQEN